MGQTCDFLKSDFSTFRLNLIYKMPVCLIWGQSDPAHCVVMMTLWCSCSKCLLIWLSYVVFVCYRFEWNIKKKKSNCYTFMSSNWHCALCFNASNGESDTSELYAFPNRHQGSRHFCNLINLYFLPWTSDNWCCTKWIEKGTFPQPH